VNIEAVAGAVQEEEENVFSKTTDFLDKSIKNGEVFFLYP